MRTFTGTTERIKNYAYIIVCAFALLGCEPYEVVNLTKAAALPEIAEPISQIDIAINEVWILEANKDRKPGSVVSHDETGIELNTIITNFTNSVTHLSSGKSSDGFKAIFDWNGKRDTVALLRTWKPEQISIKAGESVTFKLWNELYNFDVLFGERKDYDYTSDMVDLLKTMKFIYINNGDKIPFRYESGVKVVGKSLR